MTHTEKLIVTRDKTAAAVGSGLLEVFSTPCMVGLMEKAAAALVQPTLEQGYSTVGIEISTTHIKASPIGAEVSATATLTSQEGKAYKFEIEAFCNGELIGKATHTRVAVNNERFMAKVNG